MKLSCSFMVAYAMVTPMTSAGQDSPRFTFVQSTEQAATASYAVVKRPSRPVTRREALTFLLPVPYPARGVVLSFGSFLSPLGSWTVVDFDTRTIERLKTTTVAASGIKRTAQITSRVGRPLTIGEVNDIIAEANVIWNPPPSKPTFSRVTGTDSTCDVALFDRADVFHDYGFTCPVETENLVKIIGEIEIPAPEQ